MQRLFKKYKLLLWLGLLLLGGFAASTIVTFTISRDLLTQQSAAQTLPAVGDSLYNDIRINIVQALNTTSAMVNDAFVRERLDADEPDYQALVAQLKSMPRQDNVTARFVVSYRDQKYVDSLGTVRSLNPDNATDAALIQARDATRPYDVFVDANAVAGGAALMTISYGLIDAQQRGRGPIGAVGATFALDALARSIHQYVAEGGRAVYFVDRQGKILWSDKSASRTGNLHQQEGLSQLADQILSEQLKPLSAAFDRGGEPIFVRARFVPELGLTMIIEENQAPAKAVWPLLMANGAIGIVVTLLALFIARGSIVQNLNRLRALASKDSMTGLMNRQSFTSSFQQAVVEMQRLKLPMSFILFDIDNLKKINETHGHSIGDKIIKDIARLSRRSVRGSDLVCRWGGEQFALLVQRCELEQAYKIAEQLRLNVQNHTFAFDDQEASVTISLGVAEWTENETIDDLFGRVDDAVFLAKSEGRNRAEISYYMST